MPAQWDSCFRIRLGHETSQIDPFIGMEKRAAGDCDAAMRLGPPVLRVFQYSHQSATIVEPNVGDRAALYYVACGDKDAVPDVETRSDALCAARIFAYYVRNALPVHCERVPTPACRRVPEDP